MSVKVIESEDDQGYCSFVVSCDNGHDCSIHGFGQSIKTIKFCPCCGDRVTQYQYSDMVNGKLETIIEEV